MIQQWCSGEALEEEDEATGGNGTQGIFSHAGGGDALYIGQPSYGYAPRGTLLPCH